MRAVAVRLDQRPSPQRAAPDRGASRCWPGRGQIDVRARRGRVDGARGGPRGWSPLLESGPCGPTVFFVHLPGSLLERPSSLAASSASRIGGIRARVTGCGCTPGGRRPARRFRHRRRRRRRPHSSADACRRTRLPRPPRSQEATSTQSRPGRRSAGGRLEQHGRPRLLRSGPDGSTGSSVTRTAARRGRTASFPRVRVNSPWSEGPPAGISAVRVHHRRTARSPAPAGARPCRPCGPPPEPNGGPGPGRAAKTTWGSWAPIPGRLGRREEADHPRPACNAPWTVMMRRRDRCRSRCRCDQPREYLSLRAVGVGPVPGQVVPPECCHSRCRWSPAGWRRGRCRPPRSPRSAAGPARARDTA